VKGVHPFAVIQDLKRTLASLRAQWRSTRRENEHLRKENEQWRERAERLERERDQLRDENARLKRQLEQVQRAAKRQAAPFARGQRTRRPRRPGRKPGAGYGTRHRKPRPDHVNEVITVPCPAHGACGGAVEVEMVESQFATRNRPKDGLETV